MLLALFPKDFSLAALRDWFGPDCGRYAELPPEDRAMRFPVGVAWAVLCLTLTSSTAFGADCADIAVEQGAIEKVIGCLKQLQTENNDLHAALRDAASPLRVENVMVDALRAGPFFAKRVAESLSAQASIQTPALLPSPPLSTTQRSRLAARSAMFSPSTKCRRMTTVARPGARAIRPFLLKGQSMSQGGFVGNGPLDHLHAIPSQGRGQPFNNMQPFIALYFCKLDPPPPQ